MPTLHTMLKPYDAGLLRIAAGFWGFGTSGEGLAELREGLAGHMLEAELVEEMVSALPQEAHKALSDILSHAGRLPWARMTGLHGEFRQMGEARREREKPHQQPISALEVLYYRCLIGRAFMETTEGPQEFAYIPDDLLPLIPSISVERKSLPGRPASDSEIETIIIGDDRILDLVTSLLASIRSGIEIESPFDPGQREFLVALLVSSGMLNPSGEIDIERSRRFLEQPRADALLFLFNAWLLAESLDDIALVPHLEIVGPLKTKPVRSRARVMAFLADLPRAVWWGLPAFISGIKTLEPEFLRPTGNLDSRYVRDRRTGEFLHGVEHWDAVEGALVNWLLTGPLYWFGMVDLGYAAGSRRFVSENEIAPRAFRYSRWFSEMFAGRSPSGIPEEDLRVHVRSDGRISIPRLAPRSVRYLVARFCDWEPGVHDEYRYRASPGSLQRAADQGLKIDQLISLLVRHAEGIPPNITLALKSWGQYGRAARIEHNPILRLPSPEALEQLQRSRAARFLGDVLGPVAVALRPGTEERVLAVLNELGFLAEIVDEGAS